MPPEYTKGIGKKGFEKLMRFSQSGGIIISWGESTDLFSGNLSFKNGTETEEFKLPFNDISSKLAKEGLYSAGSFVKMHLKPNHPLTYGLAEATGIFYRGKPVFTTSIPSFDADRRVIGSFAEGNIKQSGYIANEKLLANKSAMIWLKQGKGQFILMGFSPIFRASTPSSYKLLFNSLLLKKITQG
jgi:hypothetical protein